MAHKIKLNIDDGNLIRSQMELAMRSFNIANATLKNPNSTEKSIFIFSKYCRSDFDLVMS